MSPDLLACTVFVLISGRYFIVSCEYKILAEVGGEARILLGSRTAVYSSRSADDFGTLMYREKYYYYYSYVAGWGARADVNVKGRVNATRSTASAPSSSVWS